MKKTAKNPLTGELETRDIDPVTDVGPRMFNGEEIWFSPAEEAAMKAEWAANSQKQAEREAAEAAKKAEHDALISKLEAGTATQREKDDMLLKLLKERSI